MSNKTEKLSKDEESMLSLLNYRSIDEEGILETKDGRFQRFLSVGTTDLYSLDRNDLAKYLDAFQLFNRVFTDEYKLVSLASRVDTSENQLYWRRLRGHSTNNTPQDQMRNRIQSENLAALINIERESDNYKELLFYIIIYSDNKKNLKQLSSSVQTADGGFLGINPVGMEATIDTVYKLNNMNSK